MKGKRHGTDMSDYSYAWERRAEPEPVPQATAQDFHKRTVSTVQSSVGI